MAFGCAGPGRRPAGAPGLAVGARHDRALGRRRSTGSAQAQAVAPAVADYRPTDPQIAFHLARFIEQVRRIPADPVVLRQNWLRAYDFATDRGALALNDYARANDPFAKVGKTQIAVEVSSVIRASPRQLPRRLDRAPLRERPARRAPSAGPRSSPSSLQPPRDAERLRKNPLGVFVNAINWSKELGQ